MTAAEAKTLKRGEHVTWTGKDAPGLKGIVTCLGARRDAVSFRWGNGDSGVIYIADTTMRHVQRAKVDA